MAEKKRWRATKKAAVKNKDKVKADRRGKLRHGERRRGPNGKMNVYNAKDGRWYRAKKVEAKPNYGKRGNTSDTVSSAKPNTTTSDSPSNPSSRPGGKNLGLGGKTRKYVSPGAPKNKDDSPSSRSTKTSKIDRIGIRGPQAVASGVAKSIGSTVSDLNRKYGPMAGMDKGPKVGDKRTRLVRGSDGKPKRVTLRWDGKKWSRQRGS